MRQGVRSVGLDLVSQSYLVIDGERLTYQRGFVAASGALQSTELMHKPPFLEELERRVLVCDGAMGTMLYARGVFLNRSFDELNLTQPDLVADVHQAYVRAGADVIETNTFGANRIKLSTFGLADRTAEINIRRGAGSRGTRRATRPIVAGRDRPARRPHRAVGQDRRRRSARRTSREQAAALLEGGVDLFVLETFRDLNEIGAAIRAVRSLCVAPDRRAGDDRRGRQHAGRRGARAFRAAARTARRRRRRPELQRRTGRDARDDRAHGARCDGTPLGAAERRTAARGRRAQHLSLLARSTWRRTRGGSSTAASGSLAAAAARRRTTSGRYAWRFGQLRQPRRPASVDADRGGRGADGAGACGRESRTIADGARACARRRSSSASSCCRRADIATDELLESARQLRIRGIDLVNIPDGPRASGRMSALATAVLIQQAGIETILHYACRDRNLLGDAVGPARRPVDGHPQPADRHRRSAADRRLSGCDGGASTSTRSA